jgi:hypothetical protein
VIAAKTYPRSSAIAIPQLLKKGEPNSSMRTIVDMTKKPRPRYSDDPKGSLESPTWLQSAIRSPAQSPPPPQDFTPTAVRFTPIRKTQSPASHCGNTRRRILPGTKEIMDWKIAPTMKTPRRLP